MTFKDYVNNAEAMLGAVKEDLSLALEKIPENHPWYQRLLAMECTTLETACELGELIQELEEQEETDGEET